jgi:hypothetical protein
MAFFRLKGRRGVVGLSRSKASAMVDAFFPK